jgi:hypothetical protein
MKSSIKNELENSSSIVSFASWTKKNSCAVNQTPVTETFASQLLSLKRVPVFLNQVDQLGRIFAQVGHPIV